MKELYNFNSRISREDTYAEKYDARAEKFGTKKLIPLWIADMDFAVSPAIQEALFERVEHPIYGYTGYYGEYSDSIVRWMTKSHSWEIERDWILPIGSVVSGLKLAVDLFSEEGDGVIIQPPIYPPFYQAVRTQNRRVLENRLIIEDGAYRIDFEDFEAKAREAKLFLFCSPHNPTGRVWSREELLRLVAICKKHNVIIVSDEIHSDLTYQTPHTPIASMDGAKEITITLNSPAKSFNIMGIVSAYAIIEDSKLREQFQAPFLRYSLAHPNLLSMVATRSAYTQSDKWLDEVKSYLSENLAYIHQRLEIIPKIKAMPTEATFLLWLDCRELQLEDEELQRFFVDMGIGLNQGVNFGSGGEGFMRLNFAMPRDVLREVFDRVEICVNPKNQGSITNYSQKKDFENRL